MLGRRFYDETGGHFNYNTYQSTNPYEPHSYLNAKNQKYNPSNFINAALAGSRRRLPSGSPDLGDFRYDALAHIKVTSAPHVDINTDFSEPTRRALAIRSKNEIPARTRRHRKTSPPPWRRWLFVGALQGCRLP